MSRSDKLISKFKSRPSDFKWNELIRLLSDFGYHLSNNGKTGGSRRRFVHEKFGFITLHEPHPGKILKHYQVDYIISVLEKEGLL